MLSSILKCSTPRKLEYEYFGVQITSEPHTINYSEVGGVSAGDKVYIYLATASSFQRPDIPTGYTSLSLEDNELENRLVYREIDGTEGSSVVVSGLDDMCAIMIKIVGGASSVVGTAFSDRGSFSLILPELTAQSGLLFAFGAAEDGGSAYDLDWGAAPSGMTELLSQGSSGVRDSMLYALYVENIVGGATGTRTLQSNSSSEYLSGVLLNIYF